MRKVVQRFFVYFLCVLWPLSFFSAYMYGKYISTRHYYLLDGPSHLFLLLDFREEMSRLPEETRAAHGMRLGKYDTLIWGYYTGIVKEQKSVEEAIKANGASEKALAFFQKKLAEAKEIAANTEIVKINAQGKSVLPFFDSIESHSCNSD